MAAYKVFVSAAITVLGVLIIVRGIRGEAAPMPLAVGAALAALGIYRLVMVLRAPARGS